MLTEFIVVSGIMFWVCAAFAVLLVAAWLGKENEAGAMILAAFALAGFWLFSDAPRHISLSWLAVITLAYLLIGVVWALHRWRAFVLERLADARKEFMRTPRDDDFPTWLGKQFGDYRRPTAEYHRERIVAWIGLWPWSMLWRIAQFPWRAIVRVYEWISGTFERMSQRLWQA